MERLLLHICCAPCSVYCVDSLRAEADLLCAGENCDWRGAQPGKKDF